MKHFNGQILFLDRNDINTDEIIPAKYLSESRRIDLKPYLLEDLSLEGFSPVRDIPGKRVIISRSNFGCGSSREHAPWALEANDIHLVIAESFARIFRRNMFNCGMMAVALPKDTIDELFQKYSGKPAQIETDIDNGLFTIVGPDLTVTLPFSISEFELALVRAGGWVNYADEAY
ncbi:MAG: 3-isopropylmalate dehydratase small subunit 2 [Desulfatirhabdiaceae bacterium]